MTTLAIDEGVLRVAGLRHIPARLMLYFMENEGRALARDVIYREVWGQEPFGELRTVDVHIARLRKWMATAHPADRIVTYRDFGYRYTEGKA